VARVCTLCLDTHAFPDACDNGLHLETHAFPDACVNRIGVHSGHFASPPTMAIWGKAAGGRAAAQAHLVFVCCVGSQNPCKFSFLLRNVTLYVDLHSL
jgi:hypothetical protein